MSAPVELTVMHRGGTRRGDVVIATSAEYHALERLKAMESRLLALVAASELISPNAAVPLAALRGAIAGAA